MSSPVRALVVWQPWASLIAIGAKRIETRGWSTNHRGPLVIYAAKRWSGEQWKFSLERETFAALRAADYTVSYHPGQRIYCPLPLGGPIAVVDLVDVRRIVEGPSLAEGACFSTPVPSSEVPIGDYTPGRFAWLLDRPRRLEWAGMPEAGGRQGLFKPSSDVLKLFDL